MRIRDIASARVRYGYRRIYVLLRREGWKVNHKRVYRLYCLEGLNLRAKSRRKKIASIQRPNRPSATRLNESWSMDFISDALYNKSRFRALTIVDNFSRQCLAIEADRGSGVTGSWRSSNALSVLEGCRR